MFTTTRIRLLRVVCAPANFKSFGKFTSMNNSNRNQLPSSFASFNAPKRQGSRRTNTNGRGRWHTAGRGGARRDVPDHGRSRRSNGGRGAHSSKRNIEIALENDLVNIEEIGSEDDANSIRVAVQGCSHGALDRIYDTLMLYQEKSGKHIDLLLCCGDFQALRNTTDLETISVPQKYREMGSFYKYYAGLKTAPILTIFVGGNHEASSYLQELYYGGWAAPNIYYLGASGVVRYRGFRIAGIGGIYKERDYDMGRFERPPYDNSSLRSVYHVRNVEVARLKLLERIQNNTANIKGNRPVVDIMISHDWPRGIERHGDTAGLVRRKQFFEKEILENNLGSPSNEELLMALKPRWWFAAHLHVKFQANFVHVNANQHESSLGQNVDDATPCDTAFMSVESSERACSSINGHYQPDLTEQMTRFLSLDKCLPRRHHLQIVSMSLESDAPREPERVNASPCLHYDLEWLAILQKTHNWTKTSRARFPEPKVDEVVITENDIDAIRAKLVQSGSGKNDDQTIIPFDFAMTLQPHGSFGSDQHVNQGQMIGNPQTDKLLNLLALDHKITVPYIYRVEPIDNHKERNSTANNNVNDDNEIDLDDV